LALSELQIERYSRQIILPQVGGRGQERLLAARIVMIGELADLESPLAYLVGAGVGTILLNTFGDSARPGYLIGQMRELNPDVNVGLALDRPRDFDPNLMFIGSERARDAATVANSGSARTALIAARLDGPGQIAIIPSRPPCLACASTTLMPFGTKGDNSELVKMVATTEALKHLVQPSVAGAIITFSGLSSHAHELVIRPNCTICTDSGPGIARK